MLNLFLPITILFLGMIVQGAFIASEYKKHYVAASILKGTAAGLFVFTAALGCFSKGFDLFGVLIVVGQFFGLVGDVLMSLRFIFPRSKRKTFVLGTSSFFLGHIFFIAALILNAKHLTVCIILGVMIAAGFLVYFLKTMKIAKVIRILGSLYLGAVFTMSVLGVDSAIFCPSAKSILFAVGAVMFAASDVLLVYNSFGARRKFTRRVFNLSLYYLGQSLIALCLWFDIM